MDDNAATQPNFRLQSIVASQQMDRAIDIPIPEKQQLNQRSNLREDVCQPFCQQQPYPPQTHFVSGQQVMAQGDCYPTGTAKACFLFSCRLSGSCPGPCASAAGHNIAT
uniref:Uncharacterized protein n=1 Tax=Eutreptiella gymnastica TaxID=73025 RepID=A0A7S4FXY7_9EUGL